MSAFQRNSDGMFPLIMPTCITPQCRIRTKTRVTILLLEAVKDQNNGSFFNPQMEPLCLLPAILMNPENLVSHSDPIDVVLEHIDSQRMRKTCR